MKRYLTLICVALFVAAHPGIVLAQEVPELIASQCDNQCRTKHGGDSVKAEARQQEAAFACQCLSKEGEAVATYGYDSNGVLLSVQSKSTVRPIAPIQRTEMVLALSPTDSRNIERIADSMQVLSTIAIISAALTGAALVGTLAYVVIE